MNFFRGFLRLLRRAIELAFVMVMSFLVLFGYIIEIKAPVIDSEIDAASFQREEIAENHFRVGNCWLKKNGHGIWEMYLEGNDYERGVIYGVLAKELMEKQEVHFVSQIREMVPNSSFRFFLKLLIAFFNRNIDDYIPAEYLREIYGVSLSFSDKYNSEGPKYNRILNYHAAHDIGHALQDYNMVGCTSFAVNKEYSKDSSLLIGRNFDFYVGDDFAEDKLLTFMNPDSGYQYASYSWAGLMGVVSGMNEKGLTVTINAAKSDLPTESFEPISLLAREILQYAGNIEEAIAIAAKRQTFVSESILVGSSSDDDAVIIEKSPTRYDVFDVQGNMLVCSNHYQGEAFVNDSANIKNISDSDSKYRYDRMMELLKKETPIDYLGAASILRNRKGLSDTDVGLGNPMTLNQLIAHHGVIFKPSEKKFWVSTPPYQEGEFICYDLNKIFSLHQNQDSPAIDSLMIPQDSFLKTDEYAGFVSFKMTKQRIQKYVMLGKELNLTESDISGFEMANPESYITYMVLGDYFRKKQDHHRAISYYEKSLTKTVASKDEEKIIRKHIGECKELTIE